MRYTRRARDGGRRVRRGADRGFAQERRVGSRGSWLNPRAFRSSKRFSPRRGRRRRSRRGARGPTPRAPRSAPRSANGRTPSAPPRVYPSTPTNRCRRLRRRGWRWRIFPRGTPHRAAAARGGRRPGRVRRPARAHQRDAHAVGPDADPRRVPQAPALPVVAIRSSVSGAERTDGWNRTTSETTDDA